MTITSRLRGPTGRPSDSRTQGLSGLILAGMLILPLPAIAQQAPAQGYVFTANETGNSVSRVDLATGAVSTLPLPIAPHNVQVTPDMRKLLVVGAPMASGSEHSGAGHGQMQMPVRMTGAGQLLVLDPLDLQAAPVVIAVGNHPAHVVADGDGRRAFVTNSEDDTITVVDLVAGRVTHTLPAGDYPHGLRLSPDGRQSLVANVADGTVSLFDAETLDEITRIPVGKAPVQVGFLPDGARAYVSLRDEDAVAVIDLASRTVIGRIPVGDGPIQLYATPDGR
ncbi:MAG: YncE family protein, partial [Alphaproteobacteria bacterium]